MNSINYKKRALSVLMCLSMASCTITPQIMAKQNARRRAALTEQFASIISMSQIAASATNFARKYYKNGDTFEKVMSGVAALAAGTFLLVTCTNCIKLAASEVKNIIKDIKNL